MSATRTSPDTGQQDRRDDVAAGATAARPGMPHVGQMAPDVDAPATAGGRFRLSDHRGSWVVVYFYPRANTPG